MGASAQGIISKWSQIRNGFLEEKIKLYGTGTDSGIFDYFTEEICDASGKSRGDFTPSEDDYEKVENSLKEAGLWDEVKDELNKSAFDLSCGQQQRLCIARALVVKPEIILMDEPTSSLDPISSAKIEELIKILKKDYTIVIVTHNMQQAARVSDFTSFFMNGDMIEYNETSKLFTVPDNKLTEEYITGRFG